MAIYLKNATFIDWQTLSFRKCHIKVQEGLQGKIDFIDAIPNTRDTVLDCSERLVTKSFANGHHHVYSALARGMPAPKKTPSNFRDILKFIWWTLDKALDQNIIRASALVTAMQCAKNGVTFVIDHHSSPNAITNSLAIIADAFDQVGISHVLCYEMSDRDGPRAREKGLHETEAYLSTGRQGLVGLHASFTVGEDLLKRAVNLARQYNTGIHMHVAEDAFDQEHCLNHYGKRVVERLSDAGALDSSRTLLAHCLHLSARERKLASQAPIHIVQNTESNLNNNVGCFDSKNFSQNIILGTDGMHSDMLRSAKAAFLAGCKQQLTSLEIYARFRKIHDYARLNSFSGDDNNNLVILNYDSPTEVKNSNFVSHFIYSLESRHVESVISSGRLIVKNRKLLTADESQILDFSRKMGKKLWSRLL
jgi:cytosine/adenosine deaminase-related metal-dependent hydrolase